MRRIPLTQGQFAIVDNDRYEELNKHKWCAQWNIYTKSFYAYRDNKGYMTSMARDILGLIRGDKKEPDHINHITLDNRTSNLRTVTHQQNSFNQRNTKGYSWNKTARKYMAQIMLNGKEIYLGYFQTTEEAREAYLKAKKQYHAA